MTNPLADLRHVRVEPNEKLTEATPEVDIERVRRELEAALPDIELACDIWRKAGLVSQRDMDYEVTI